MSDFRGLPQSEQAKVFGYLSNLERQSRAVKAQSNFLEFVKLMWPSFVSGRHHSIIASAFERVANGQLKRLIINLPPRHSKSELSSYLFPAWYLGKYPEKKIIQASNTSELALRFGRKVRNLVMTPEYQDVFPGTVVTPDSRSRGRWDTSAGGEYYAIGVGGTISGRGADVYVIDDPHSEQEAMMAAHDPEIYDSVYEWYTSGPRQRLQPKGSIIIIQTRWGARDLTGQVLKTSAQRGGNEWEVIELPAIMPSGAPLWPEFWPLEELIRLREELPRQKWSAQYQQQPTSEEIAIVKASHWRRWPEKVMPKCDYIIQSWDTALTTTERSNASACTTWGVFYHSDDRGKPSIILLDAIEQQLDFLALKRMAKLKYADYRPDTVVVEAKAAGSPLIFELRAMGLPVVEFTPTRGQTKLARVNAVADLFSSGVIWAPNNEMADRVITQFAEFPHGDSDDLVDSSSQALLRFRAGGFVKSAMDEQDEPILPRLPIEWY